MFKALTLTSLLFLTSCSYYRSAFDCPAYPGTGCHSVSEIEAMIQENPYGSDTLECGCSNPSSPQTIKTPSPSNGVKRIWICPYTYEEGHYVEGHFLYFDLDNDSEPKGGAK